MSGGPLSRRIGAGLQRRQLLGAGFASVFSAASVATTPALKGWPAALPALAYREPKRQPMLAAALAGRRVVAAGMRGVVIWSDDGNSYSQAAVPVSSDITALTFVDENNGWAVGDDGVILATGDGGKTWALQRQAFGGDDRLFSVMFSSRSEGLAVGAFGLALRTGDGGRNWSALEIAREGANTPHLYQLLPGRAGGAIVVGEFGSIFSGWAVGQWSSVVSPVKNSLFGGAVCGGKMVAVGLQGTAIVSDDGGLQWRAASVANAPNLVTAISGPAHEALLLDARGGLLGSCDGGHRFASRAQLGSINPTCVVWHPAWPAPRFFSLEGVVPAAHRAAEKSRSNNLSAESPIGQPSCHP